MKRITIVHFGRKACAWRRATSEAIKRRSEVFYDVSPGQGDNDFPEISPELPAERIVLGRKSEYRQQIRNIKALDCQRTAPLEQWLNLDDDRHSSRAMFTDEPSITAYKAELPTRLRQSEHTSRNPLGLGPVAFGLLVAFVTAIVVGAAVGGAVAGSMTSRKDSWYVGRRRRAFFPRHSLTMTQFSSYIIHELVEPCYNDPYYDGHRANSLRITINSTHRLFPPPAPSAVSSLFLDCPALNSQSYTNILFGDKYTQFCGQDFTGGLPAKGGGVIADIAGIIAYSASDCMDACSIVNNLSNRWKDGIQCQAISFSTDLHHASRSLGANCWLKNATIASGTQGNVNDHAVSATLG